MTYSSPRNEVRRAAQELAAQNESKDDSTSPETESEEEEGNAQPSKRQKLKKAAQDTGRKLWFSKSSKALDLNDHAVLLSPYRLNLNKLKRNCRTLFC